MLPHRAMLSNRNGGRAARRPAAPGRRVLPLLPPPLPQLRAHVGGFLLASIGLEVVFSRGADRLAAEFQEVKPAIITAVPRLFEVLRARILAGVEKEGGLKEKLFNRALALGLRRMDGPLPRPARPRAGPRAGPAGAGEGAGALRRGLLCLSPAARARPDCRASSSRSASVIRATARPRPARSSASTSPGTTGATRSGPAARRRGRIAGWRALRRGELVMDGYWNPPRRRAAPRSVGSHRRRRRDHRRRILITDRKRDFIKTLGGDMVSPARSKAC
jgi:long-chain acyl-CoA synthetase